MQVTRISQRGGAVTLINVFTVATENQQRLLDVLVEATEPVMRGLPSFVAANLHKSLDGTKVANYTQWRSQEHFGDARGFRGSHEHAESRRDRRKVRAAPVRGLLRQRGSKFLGPRSREPMSRQQKRPPVKSGGRTLLSLRRYLVFQHVRPQLQERRIDDV